MAESTVEIVASSASACGEGNERLLANKEQDQQLTLALIKTKSSSSTSICTNSSDSNSNSTTTRMGKMKSTHSATAKSPVAANDLSPSANKNHQSSTGNLYVQHTSSPSAGGAGDVRKVSTGANSTAGARNSKSCCFCWCCCYRCACLSSRKQEEDLNKSKDITSRDSWSNDPDVTPSLEEIRCWGDSFDRLMRSSMGRVVFREFLKCEYSEENILFWLACEDLKKDSNPEVVEEKARLIFEDYISILSPKEVSLDSRVREIVNRNMMDPTLHTFDEAQLQIYTLMHRDSYPRFVNSAFFKKLSQRSNSSRKESSA